jgi:hypothetical protein
VNPKEALARLRAYPEFEIVMRAAEDERPFLHPLNPKDDLDKQANRALWESAARTGFDLLMNYMRGHSEWQNRRK